jgi:hypothetical protein
VKPSRAESRLQPETEGGSVRDLGTVNIIDHTVGPSAQVREMALVRAAAPPLLMIHGFDKTVLLTRK